MFTNHHLLEYKMRLNGKIFDIYITDTVATIESRIAASMKTLPRWLLFESHPKPTTLEQYNNIDDDDDLRVVNYLALVSGHTEITTAAVFKTLPNPPPTLTANEIQDVFIATNQTLITQSSNLGILFHTMKGFYRDPEAIFRDRTRIMGVINKDIQKNIEDSANHVKLAVSIERLPSIKYTDFELDHTQFTLELKMAAAASQTTPVVTLAQLFNSLRISRHIPYAAMTAGGNDDDNKSLSKNTIFKIYKSFEINPQWLEISLSNVIFMKVDTERDNVKPLPAVKWNRYTNAAITINKDDGRIYATMNVNIGNRFVSKDEFIARFMAAFPTLKVINATDNLVVVYFALPNQCMNNIVFYELTMNSPLFNSLVVIDESLRPSKLSQTVYLRRLGGDGSTVNLHQKITTRHNEYGMANIGEPYVMCRMKTQTTDAIGSFQKLLGKLFTVYNNEYDSVVTNYKKYIKNISFIPCSIAGGVKKKIGAVVKQQPPTGLRAIAPEVFAPNFSRKCANAPEILPSDASVVAAGKQTMQFPTHGEVDNGGIPIVTRTYYCPTDHHPYVGLRNNTLENKELFPLIPCCFAMDQIEKPGSLYRKYFHGENETKRARKLQNTAALARRILDIKDVEELPDKIKTLFSIIEQDPRVKYMRNGITRSRHSAVEAILVGKGQVNYRTQRTSTIANRVRADIDKLQTDRFAMAAKQELYDKSISDIRYMLANDDLRPSRFIRTLELAMDCNIFVFSPDSLLVPEHKHGYYKLKPDRETFLLFEHYGDTERFAIEPIPSYPQIELITRSNNLSFLPGDPVIKRLYSIFRRMTRTYINDHIAQPQINRLQQLPILGQKIDAYGKCRIVNCVAALDAIITMVTVEPHPPFAVDELNQLYRVELNVLRNFANKWNLQIQWQRMNSAKEIVEVGLTVGGGVNVVALVQPTAAAVLPGIEFDTNPAQYETIRSTLKEFMYTSKSASILFEYAMWLISRHVKLPPTTTTKSLDSDLVNFVNNHVIIDRTHTYYPYESVVFMDPSSFVRNNKLILTSVELLKRLMFACRIKLLTTQKVVTPTTYSSSSSVAIPNFYSDIGDFEDSPNSFIVEGTDAVRNLIETYGAEMQITKTIKLTGRPYYFKNELIHSKKIYLAQPVSSLENAILTVSAWTRLGVNSTLDGDINDVFPIYTYINELDIRLISDGGRYDAKGCILAYKKNDIPHYVALIEVN